MSHIGKHKSRLIARVRRMKGQLDALERALDEEAGHSELLNLVASARGAINGLTAEVVEHHIREHVSDPDKDPDRTRAEGAAELIDLVRTYLK